MCTEIALILHKHLSFVYFIDELLPLSLWIELSLKWASLVIQMTKNPPAMWETWVQSLGLEDPLEEGMATHSIKDNGIIHLHSSDSAPSG